MKCVPRGWECLIVGLLLLSGCGGRGDQPELGLVTGTVTMDGEPLAKALVSFGPTNGRPSNGITNGDGKYELNYLQDTRGAKVGDHKVSITTYYEDEDSQEALTAKEKIPKQYNSSTTLKSEVKPGKNVIDFNLQSK